MYAKDFSEILGSISRNEKIKSRILRLIESEKISGKVTEGDGRVEALREILASYFNLQIDLNQAISDVEFKIPRHYRPHENNNRAFPQGWAERLIRTSVRRFYNQAVLMEIIESGGTECFIPHGDFESRDSNCSKYLAGSKQNASVMLERLLSAYRDGNWTNDLKIPDHPHCTHTVQPA
ncbi:hypothetical protein [Stutzerimonas nitrititolerans]|uniref:hypothetical protein n=1 Tax=Stutzerimonas nitrititolerans TaxID=2482751 RepID=UPI00289E6554|nr:hypothetical protein [Stutzerimonas nitrititolerans]